MNIPLEQPWSLLLIPLGLFAVLKLVRQKSGIGFSSSANLLKGVGIRFQLLHLERLMLAVFIVTGALILARPVQLIKQSVPIYKEARDITVVLDISGSMSSGEKLKTATSVIGEFAKGRPQDRIALVTFDTRAYLDWPLSLDHKTLNYRLEHMALGGGTRIAAGIIAGLEHQRKFGQNPGAIIVVSDGSSDVYPKEKETIEKALGQTKLYWVWIDSGEYDRLALEFGGYVTSLGGKVYQGGIEHLGKIFADINQLEASPVIYEQRVTTVYHFGRLPQIALVSLLLTGLAHLLREV